jgi:hypothetical protein
MSSRFINSQQACAEGLRIVEEQVTNYLDHRAQMELRKKEQEHLTKCTVCNPTLLAEGFFKKTVVILTEVHHE